jgi:hydrogenase maturation protease
MMSPSSVTLIIGLGNPLLSDDGVGWQVAEQLKAYLTAGAQNDLTHSIEIDTLPGGGLSLMERLVGYDQAILIDAIQSGQQVGSVKVFQLEQLENPFAGHLGSTHETNLQTALEIGRQLNAHLPQIGAIFIVAIEAQTVYDFSDQLSPPVAAAVVPAMQAVLKLLNQEEI